jgi:hypothetical protein
LKEYQAYYLLKKLVKAGKLKPAGGKGRGAYYQLAETNAQNA